MKLLLKPGFIILLAVLLAAAAVIGVYFYLEQEKEKLSSVEKGYAITTKTEIPAKTRITKEMVEEKEIPSKYLHPRAVKKLDEVIGSITRYPLAAGELVLSSKIVKESEIKDGLAYLIPEGERAVTVAVDEVSSVGWHLRPGDQVDVIATLELSVPGAESGEKTELAVVALQEVNILAVGKDLEVIKEDGKNQTEVKTVTLAVTLEEAKHLVLADEKGKIRLALRSPVERGKKPSAPFKMQDFFKLFGAPKAPGS